MLGHNNTSFIVDCKYSMATFDVICTAIKSLVMLITITIIDVEDFILYCLT